MNDDQAFEARKGRLLYRALADFSDACEAPELTPECPFFTRMADGSPVCAEECKDILGDDLAPGVADTGVTVDLGDDIEAVKRPRPRPRRPSTDLKPFDGMRMYLNERHRPVDSWSMPSLINGLRDQFAAINPDEESPPSLDRVMQIKAELEWRGVDFERLLRRGLTPYIVGSIFYSVFESVRGTGDDDGGWTDIFCAVDSDFADRRKGGTAGVDDDGAIHLNPELFRVMFGWVTSAPIEDLLDRRVRQGADELLAAGRRHEAEPDHDAVWLVQRFTVTYLERWRPSSLKSEWRYLHSERPGCCPPGHMRDRIIDATELAPHLAELACKRMDRDEMREDPPLDVGQFLPIAVEALGRGDYQEAASIYRMLHHVRPNDNEITNNLGFCLLPTAPKEAVEFFKKTLGGPDRPVKELTLLNLALAQSLAGDYSEAEQSVNKARRYRQPGPFHGWMWSLDKVVDGIWTLGEVNDLDKYTSDLLQFVQALAAAADNKRILTAGDISTHDRGATSERI